MLLIFILVPLTLYFPYIYVCNEANRELRQLLVELLGVQPSWRKGGGMIHLLCRPPINFILQTKNKCDLTRVLDPSVLVVSRSGSGLNIEINIS